MVKPKGKRLESIEQDIINWQNQGKRTENSGSKRTFDVKQSQFALFKGTEKGSPKWK